MIFGLDVFVCFQAEDGIRDLVRSRGLGDVYKRQAGSIIDVHRARAEYFILNGALDLAERQLGYALDPVSYTHLTLPTSDLV